MSNLLTLTVLAQQSDQGTIVIPHDVFDRGCCDFGDFLSLLDVEKNSGICRSQYKASRATVKYFIGLKGRLDRLDDGV